MKICYYYLLGLYVRNDKGIGRGTDLVFLNQLKEAFQRFFKLAINNLKLITLNMSKLRKRFSTSYQNSV